MLKKGFVIICLLFIAGITGIYIFAWLSNSSDLQFTGFLANPLDSFSYLAKMRQGYEGSWLFILPFSSSKSIPAFLFEYYLLLGQFARWTHLSLLAVYHGARLVNAGFMVWAIWEFLQIPGLVEENEKIGLWSMVILGSGCGWLAALWGVTTADLWVAEAFPFLSAYTNPHFPLAIGCMLMILKLGFSKRSLFRLSSGMFLALLLAIIQPFGLVLVVLILGSYYLIEKFQKTGCKCELKFILAISLVALPFAILYFGTIQRDPLLQLWNSQNVTPSPPWWDVLLSFSPALPAILIGVIVNRKKMTSKHQFLWVWVLIGLGFLIIPVQLQRRFLIGIYIPLTILAWNGIKAILERYNRGSARAIRWIYMFLAIPTNILLLAIGFFGVQQQVEWYYFRTGELNAFQWISQNTYPDDVVFSDSQTSLFVPGMANRRVVYGHPYETPGAIEKENFFPLCLQNFQSDECINLLKKEQVKWIFINPLRIDLPSDSKMPENSSVMYSDGGIRVYEVQ